MRRMYPALLLTAVVFGAGRTASADSVTLVSPSATQNPNGSYNVSGAYNQGTQVSLSFSAATPPWYGIQTTMTGSAPYTSYNLQYGGFGSDHGYATADVTLPSMQASGWISIFVRAIDYSGTETSGWQEYRIQVIGNGV